MLPDSCTTSCMSFVFVIRAWQDEIYIQECASCTENRTFIAIVITVNAATGPAQPTQVRIKDSKIPTVHYHFLFGSSLLSFLRTNMNSE